MTVPFAAKAPIAEAIPNAFLGVPMPEIELLPAPWLKRGRRFDWLYKRIVKSHPKNLGEFYRCKINGQTLPSAWRMQSSEPRSALPFFQPGSPSQKATSQC